MLHVWCPDVLFLPSSVRSTTMVKAERILLKGHRIIVQVLVHITLIWSAYLWPIDHVAVGRGRNFHNIS